MQGKIALEEHFFLPSFAAYGADPSPLAQVRHGTGQKLIKSFRISSGSRRVYTTFAIALEPIRKHQPELLKQ
jgi:hypothetical protein